MKRVLALDPGDRVGWARATIADDGEWSDVRHGITPLKEAAISVHRELVRLPRHTLPAPPYPDELPRPWPHYDVVVVERWALFAHMAKKLVGSEIPSAQFVGMVKLSCWLAGVPCVMQSPSQVNSNRAGVLAPAEAAMKRLRPELFEQVTRAGAHDDLHDMVALKHLFLWTFKNTNVGVTHG